jgi:hypothetical protein
MGLAGVTSGEALFLSIEATAMRYRIEFIRAVPGQEDEVMETITLGATLRAAEARAHALFENAAAGETADGFRIIESPRREVLRWMRGYVQAP